jgi:hypothetical protein
VPPVSRTSLQLAEALRTDLAAPAVLTSQQARLYSQAVRLEWGAGSLPRWTPEQAQAQYDDAVRLIEAAQILTDSDHLASAADCYRRAGDVLEWLGRVDRPELSRAGELAALPLLAAACYQLAGLPAMASGILARSWDEDDRATLFSAFLRGDFRNVQRWTTNFWRNNVDYTRLVGSAGLEPDQLAAEVVRSLGLFATAIERDEPVRLQLALRKLTGLSQFVARALDPCTWLTMSLTAAVAERYTRTSLWRGVEPLRTAMTDDGKRLLDVFVRTLFRHGRGLLWPSQEAGVRRLVSGGSFAMCTPTGSGKTTIAELAVVQTLHERTNGEGPPPLVIYLVPSRALAAEAETRLVADLHAVDPNLTVTGLYGGADWSLADAWLTAEGPAILVSTVEMAESLLRYVGPLMLPRVRLLIVDEAHQVQFLGSRDSFNSLFRAEDRSARLEQFAARLFTNAPTCRAIALSAVAGGAEEHIAKWFARDSAATALGTNYRSTRQLVGVLECRADGSSVIRLELLNGRRLQLADRESEAYIPRPFAAMPRVTGRLRADTGAFVRTHVLWAAIQLAHAGRRVLISVTSLLDSALGQFRELFESQASWVAGLPSFFVAPTSPNLSEIYEACLTACDDYCGATSHEAFFLRHGIAVHHGQLPVRVRRLMTETVRAGITPITVATSTLTEGVNLPFDVILLPSIVRPELGADPPQWEVLSAGEFLNLAGRAGRPGTGVEGLTLIAVPTEGTSRADTKARREQEERVRREARRVEELFDSVHRGPGTANGRSPIATLLNSLWLLWQQASRTSDADAFLRWLEAALPGTEAGRAAPVSDAARDLSDALDAVDLILLAAVEEAERLQSGALSGTELEAHIKRLWSHTYAHYASRETAWLERIFVTRGVAIPTRIYPDRDRRRFLYQLGLPPAFASGFESVSDRIELELRGATGFVDWSVEQRYALFERIASILESEPRFGFRRIPAGTNWQSILRWWLQAPGLGSPSVDEVRDWLRVGTSEFEFRLGVAISSTVAAVWTRVRPDDDAVPDLETWRELTGLPWSAFWLRELLAWGTLDPVVAFVIGSGHASTRLAAMPYISSYDDWWQVSGDTDRENYYHPGRLRRWFDDQVRPRRYAGPRDRIVVAATLTREPGANTPSTISVHASFDGRRVLWFDGAGYHLASSEMEPPDPLVFGNHDFVLLPRESVVQSMP